MPLVPLKIQKAKRRERGKLWQRLREDTKKEVWMVVGGIIPQVTTQMNIKNKIKVKTCILKDDLCLGMYLEKWEKIHFLVEILLCNSIWWMYRKASSHMVWKAVSWTQINELDLYFLTFYCTKYLLNFIETGFVWFVFVLCF